MMCDMCETAGLLQSHSRLLAFFIKACPRQAVIFWPRSVIPSLREILYSAISALLLSLNQSIGLALLPDRGRTLSGRDPDGD